MTKYHKNQAKLRYYIDGMICQYCYNALSTLGSGTAHRIPQKNYLLKKYGEKVIHHNMNLVPACLEHNSKYLIEGKPGKIIKLLKLIVQKGKEYLTTKEINNILEG